MIENRVYTSDFKKLVADDCGVTQNVAYAVIRSFVKNMQAELVTGKDVELSDFIILRILENKARKVRNPKTGDTLDKPAVKKLRIKLSAAFKRALNT